MLFGGCNCNVERTLIDIEARIALRGRSELLICANWHAAQASQTAQAQALGSRVPEVDRLAVRMVTDNEVIQFVPSEKRDGVAIERRMGSNTTSDAPPRTALNGEWGLSMHAEFCRGNEVRNILIDFGYTPEALLNNMSILKIDASIFDALVLSHGHYDHFGGMVGFVSANRSKLKKSLPLFVGGEDCFCTRTTGNGAQYGSLDRNAIIDANLSLMMAEGPAIVADHAFTSGKIAQVSSEKPLQPTKEKVGVINGFGCFADKMSPAKNTGTFIPDDFEHEIGTNFVVKGKGSGRSHLLQPSRRHQYN